jgi:FAD/FMN-containing dehydrogenase
LVDMGGLRHCELNEGSGVVSVSPSITAQQLYDYLAERGRTFPVGHCPDVGLGGFLLGGGMGWDQPVRSSRSITCLDRN